VWLCVRKATRHEHQQVWRGQVTCPRTHRPQWLDGLIGRGQKAVAKGDTQRRYSACRSTIMRPIEVRLYAEHSATELNIVSNLAAAKDAFCADVREGLTINQASPSENDTQASLPIHELQLGEAQLVAMWCAGRDLTKSLPDMGFHGE
jgi:hypothetical protein